VTAPLRSPSSWHRSSPITAGSRRRRARSAALSAIGAGLYSIGIPKNSVLQYETALKAGKFLLVAHGSKAEIERARSVLAAHKPEAVEVHAAKAA
jgi:hypothetical protein